MKRAAAGLEQLALAFDVDEPAGNGAEPGQRVERRRRRTIQERFLEFHAEHPDVWARLVTMGRQLRARGFRHYGIRSLWEGLRWHYALEHGPDPAEDFKLNDHYPSRYARLMAETYPEEFGQFFEFRELRAE